MKNSLKVTGNKNKAYQISIDKMVFFVSNIPKYTSSTVKDKILPCIKTLKTRIYQREKVANICKTTYTIMLAFVILIAFIQLYVFLEMVRKDIEINNPVNEIYMGILYILLVIFTGMFLLLFIWKNIEKFNIKIHEEEINILSLINAKDTEKKLRKLLREKCNQVMTALLKNYILFSFLRKVGLINERSKDNF